MSVVYQTSRFVEEDGGVVSKSRSWMQWPQRPLGPNDFYPIDPLKCTTLCDRHSVGLSRPCGLTDHMWLVCLSLAHKLSSCKPVGLNRPCGLTDHIPAYKLSSCTPVGLTRPVWSYRPMWLVCLFLVYKLSSCTPVGLTSWSDQTSVVLQTNVVGMFVSSLQAKLL